MVLIGRCKASPYRSRQSLRSMRRWRDIRVDEYLETIYFLAFPIGEYRPQATGLADALVARRRDARRLARVGRRDAEAARGGGARRARRAQGGDPHRRRAACAPSASCASTGSSSGCSPTSWATPPPRRTCTPTSSATRSRDDMVERIDERLGHPERCPHGWPVDTDVRAGREPRARAARRRSSPAPRATIVRLAEHDGDLLHWFYDEGLVPGRERRAATRPSRPPASSACGSTATRRRSARRPPPACSCGRRARPASNSPSTSWRSGGRRRGRAGGGAERAGLVGPLPREVVVVAAEVAVRGGLRVDRAAQVEVAQDRGRAQVEVLADELLDPRDRDVLGVEAARRGSRTGARRRSRRRPGSGSGRRARPRPRSSRRSARRRRPSGRPSSGPCRRTRRRRAGAAPP